MGTKTTNEAGEPVGGLARVQDLADVLNVPVKTIYARAKRDGWPCYRVGRDIRFDLEEILALLRRDSG